MSGKELLYRFLGVLVCIPVAALLAALVTWAAHLGDTAGFFVGIIFGVLAASAGDVLGQEVYHRRRLS